MTTPRSYADDVPPTITLDGDAAIRTSAGSAIGARAYVTNRAPEPRLIAIAFLGVDADWLPDHTRSRVLMPGETVPMDFTLHPAVGTLSARYPFAITAQAIDPASGQAMSSAAIADYALVVDAPGRVEVQVVPNEMTRRLRGKVSIKVTNVGSTAENVRIEVNAPDNLDFSLATDEVEVPPGGSATVPARVAVAPQTFGRPTRYSYTVTARGRGAARRTDAAITTRAVLGNTGPKFFAIIAIVALWAGLAITLIPTVVNKINQSGNSAQDKVATAQDQALNKLRKTQTATPEPGTSGSKGSGSGGSGSGGSGSGGSGSGGSGSGGSGSGGSGSGGSGGASASSGKAVQFSGTVTGESPAGVTVAMRPTSLITSEAQSAKGIGVDLANSRQLGKIPAEALTTVAPTVSDDGTTAQSVVTKTDGGWGFARVRAPGYYLVTFSKPGFQSQSFVLDASSAAAAEPMKVDLLPGPGTLEGRVSGPDGAVDGATITVTDGTTTLTSSSNSTRDKGSWRIEGLSAPASYLVTVSKEGLGTASRIVELGAKDSATVDLTMSQNSYTLTGTVGLTGSADKVGGATVTATSADSDAPTKTIRTSTSITTGGLRGTYFLPDLPRGDYVVTTQADGYLTQSAKISIPERSEVNPELSSASANVSGTISRYALDKNGKELTAAQVVGRGGAGVTLFSDTNRYKITANDDGFFDFTGVVPGTYTLSAEYAGYRTSYLSVEATLDGTTPNPANLTLPLETITNDGSITGYVSGGNNPGGTVLCPDPTDVRGDKGCQISLTLRDSGGADELTSQEKSSDPKDYVATTIVTPAVSGPTSYTLFGLDGLEPGLYRLTVGADGYLPVTVTVRVGTGVSSAPPAALYRANAIIGTLHDMHGDIKKDHPSSDPHDRVTCVWAYPEGQQPQTGSGPGDCTAPTTKNANGTDNKNFGTCQRDGRAEIGTAVIGADPNGSPTSYRIPGLCDGTYYLYVFTNNEWYVNSTEIRTVNLSQGTTFDFDPHVVREGVVQLDMTYVDPDTGQPTGSGGLTGTLAECRTADGNNHDSAGSFTANDTSVDIFGVNEALNPQTCFVNATGAGGEVYTGKVSNVKATNDATVSPSVVLTPKLSSISGRLVSPYNGETRNSVPGAKLSVYVKAGYDGSAPGQDIEADVTTDSSGCFAIIGHDESYPAGTGSCAGKFDSTNTFELSGELVARRVTFKWDGISTVGTTTNGLFVPVEATDPPVTLSSSATTDVPVTAQPVATATTVDPAHKVYKVTVSASNADGADTSANLNAAKVTITHNAGTSSDTAVGAGSVSAAVNTETPQTTASRSVSIHDDNFPANPDALSPGKYTVTATLAGYGTASGTLNCTLATSSTSTCDTLNLVLKSNGALSGTIRGILGPQQNYTNSNGDTVEYPSNQLDDATVAIKCTTTDTCGSTTLSTVTKNGGAFDFTQNGVASALPPGTYSYTVTSPSAGYDDIKAADNKSVVVKSGETVSLPRDYLLAKPLTLNVGIKTNDTTYYECGKTSDKCAVTLTRLVTSSPTSVNSTTGTYTKQCVAVDKAGKCTAEGFRFVFSNVSPGDYEVAISGDELTGITFQYTVKPTGQSTNYDPTVGTTKNTVQGSVGGPTGKNGATTALNDVTVELGTATTNLNGTTTFTVAKATDGTTPLSTTTSSLNGVRGSFFFAKVPPKVAYAVRYNGADSGTLRGYRPATDSTPSVAGAIVLPTKVLDRISQSVSVSVKTTGSAGDVSGSVVSLVSAADSTWTQTNPGAPPVGEATDSTYTWTFQGVPYDKAGWQPVIVLPSKHFGELTVAANAVDTPTLSCPAGSASANVKCTTTGAFTAAATDKPSALSYELDENKLVFSVLAKRLDTDPKGVPPATVKLLQLKGDSKTVYSDDNFSVQSNVTDNPITDFIWGRSGTTYQSTVTSGVSNWTSDTKDLPDSGQIMLTELGSKVTIKVTGLPIGATDATVSLVVPTDSGVKNLDSPAVTVLAPSADISDVPYYDGYKASVTYKKADGTSVTKTNTTPTNVNGATETATVPAI